MGAAKLPSLTVYDVSTRAPIRNEQAVAGKIGRNWVYFWVAKRMFVGVRTGDEQEVAGYAEAMETVFASWG
jgi:hypothetical protein